MGKDLDRWKRLDEIPEEEVAGTGDLFGAPLQARFGGLIDGAARRGAGLQPDDRVGAYRIVRRLGEGGMGAVFLARRDDGAFEHEVALKILRSGLGDAGVKRFLQERQILAGLKHPHIAQLHDGGVIDGSPYLVMEPVDGRPVTEYCRDQDLGLEARLRLMLQACDALRYAHREGVIHRDIKPSNLLVELGPHGDARLVVLDFGIARLEGTSLGATATGQIFGTPGYMAPEQGLGRRDAADRRSDVFSLGVVLYELISGERPFPGNDVAEVLERVHDGRAVPLGQRSPAVSRDLVTVVETCLAPEPERRYDSVRGLADDLEAYLDGRPIQARPVGLIGGLWRRARRHPKTAMVMATASLTVLASLVVALGTAVSYTRALEAERQTALEARGDAEDLLDFMLEDLHTGLDRLGRVDLMEDVAREALEHYSTRPPAESEAQIVRRSRAFRNVGMVFISQGDKAGALEAFRRNRERFQALVDRDPNPVWRLEMARAERLIADVLVSKGEVLSARQTAEAALGWSEGLSSEPPVGWAEEHYEILLLLGWIQREAGERGPALESLRSAREFAEALAATSGDADWRHHVAVAIGYLGLVDYQDGQYASALVAFTEAETRCAQLVAEDPADTTRREEYQLTLSRLGWAHLDNGDAEASAEAFRAAQREGQTLVDLEPGNAGWVRELSVAHSGLAVALRQLGRLDEALSALEASLAISRTRSLRFPDSRPTANDLAWDLLEIGRFHRELGDPAAAERFWVEAVERLRPLRIESGGSPYFLETEAQALLELGRVDEATPLVLELFGAGWADPDFLALAAEHGLTPST
ncbi:MAG: protein kinase [Acidobacteriota bacterium]